MRIDLARLNYILIPKTQGERERWQRSWLARVASPLTSLFWGALTDEGRTFFVLCILVGAFGADVRHTSVHVLFATFAGALVGSLVAARTLRADDVDVTVTAPRHVTVGEPVSLQITCTQRPGGAGSPPPLRLRGPFLPWDGSWLDPPPRELALAVGGSASVSTRARFTARGLHHLDPFTAAAVVPLGLAVGPRRPSAPVKIHVVPRIANVTRLSMPSTARPLPGGVALASRRGEAMGLHGVRPYRPGDQVRDLHAKGWARTGRPVTREYEQEHSTRVGVVLDTDGGEPERLEAAIEVAAGIVAHLTRTEALVDVLVVGPHVHELTAGRRLGTLERVLELLAAVEGGDALHAEHVAARLAPYLDRLSGVVVVAQARGDGVRELSRAVERRGVATKTVVVDREVVRAVRERETVAW